MVKLRIGLIGYGAWGGHHARVIAECPDAELVAVAESSQSSRAEAKLKYPAAAVYQNFHDLVKRSDLDAVSIVLPSHLHHQAGRAALNAGKHVLMEKPLALDPAECDDLLELASSKSLTLAVGQQFRFSSLWGKVKEMIDAGAIGDPKYLLIELWRNPYRLGSDGWRYDIERVGNWILEEPIHFFDLARWYFARFGEPLSVYARANARSAEHPELQDNFTAILNFPGGRYAVIAQTLSAFEHHQVVKVTGATGALWASWSGAMDRTFHPTFSLQHFDGRNITEIPLSPAGEVFELAHEIAGFARAVRTGSPPLAGGQDGRWAVLMCLKAQQSVDSGAVVSF